MNNDETLMNQLIKECNECGFKVENYEELKGMKRIIKGLIPTLIKYLDAFNTENFKDAVICLLGTKGFYEATETLLELYFSKDARIDKWSVGDALYSIQDKRFEDEYIKIVSDKENGIARQMVVILLGKLRCEKAIPILIKLLDDEEVNGHSIMALGYFNNAELIKYIQPFLNNEKRWIRKEAEKAIKKIKS